MIVATVSRRMRGTALLAGVLALLLQLFSWTLVMPARTSPANWIIVCTAEGLVHLDVDGPPAGTAGKELPAKAPDTGGCPLCPLVGGLHLPPPLHLVPQAAVARHSPLSLPGRLVLAGWFLSTLQARAPPA
ncbi:DUF2946 family protein [Azospirillum picis]|uniref:DUF2946 domain-containing protein n=1 Tax=Azospirillum picis TaxID=488438 RepID=A0ABU0MSL2_9PROT|nr:DUF2946 family protein [Azospirillum picis]MBP2302704.1 hypothetical protein [Azospirillum picis]MDQ0536455.1 hypothetical protein [Azospirillum picis]